MHLKSLASYSRRLQLVSRLTLTDLLNVSLLDKKCIDKMNVVLNTPWANRVLDKL